MIFLTHRAFYGNRFGLTFPLFVHYGPDPRCPRKVDPSTADTEALDLVTSMFGGMSNRERNRIKVRSGAPRFMRVHHYARLDLVDVGVAV